MSTTDTSEKVEPVKAYSTVTGQAMGLGLILLAGLWATPIEFWQGPQSLHIGLEFIAALLAIVVALRYASEWVLVLLFFWSARGYKGLHKIHRSPFYDWATATAVTNYRSITL